MVVVVLYLTVRLTKSQQTIIKLKDTVSFLPLPRVVSQGICSPSRDGGRRLGDALTSRAITIWNSGDTFWFHFDSNNQGFAMYESTAKTFHPNQMDSGAQERRKCEQLCNWLLCCIPSCINRLSVNFRKFILPCMMIHGHLECNNAKG